MNSTLTTLRKKFPKQEHLKSRTSIKLLFARASTRKYGCIKLLYMPNPAEASHKTLFSVQKFRIKKAHDRNTLKRRMREAYRLNRHLIRAGDLRQKFLLAFVYLPNSTKKYADINNAVVDHLQFLALKSVTN